VKNFTGLNSAAAEADAGAAAVSHQEPGDYRGPRSARHWTREVLRRGVFELLYLGANVAIAADGLLWLYQLLTHRRVFDTALILTAAGALSLCAYYLARWRANATMSRQVEKLTAWLIATLGMATGWGGICCAVTFIVLRWLSAPESLSWIIGATAGLCGFAYMVGGEWRELRRCLAPPAAAIPDRQSSEGAA
jgi:hypothetical protein